MMQFAAGVKVVRLRRKPEPDPLNPARERRGSWDDAEAVEVVNAFVASVSSSASRSATREMVISSKSLFCPPGADVVAGDRIVFDGVTFEVAENTVADVNPFTGWQPVREVPLKAVSG